MLATIPDNVYMRNFLVIIWTKSLWKRLYYDKKSVY